MRPNRLPRDTEDIPRGYVYCSACGEWLAPGTAYDCAHGVPFGTDYGPQDIFHEYQAGELPITLSFGIRCF
jgi:hypothetical protein